MDVLDQAPALKALKLLGEELSTGSGHRFFSFKSWFTVCYPPVI
jgi:hypothetical protein